MRYLIKADRTHRKIFSQNEWRSNVLQAVARTVQLPLKYRIPVAVAMNTPQHIEHSFVRIRNRCVVSNRGNGVYRGLGLCRICFRKWANEGLIPGVRKSSW